MFGAPTTCSASLRHVAFYKLHDWHATKATLEAEARPGDLLYVQLPALHALWSPADYQGTVCGLASTADLASRLDAVAADLAALREAGLNVVVALASPKCDPSRGEASSGDEILRAYEDQEAAFHAGRAPPLHDGPAADLADRFDARARAEAAKHRTDTAATFAAAAARVRATGVLEPEAAAEADLLLGGADTGSRGLSCTSEVFPEARAHVSALDFAVSPFGPWYLK